MFKNRQVYNFSPIFKYAEKHYEIGWNQANDIFFGNVLEYGKYTDVYPFDWASYIDQEDNHRSKALDYTAEEVLAMSKSDQSYIILAAYFESVPDNVDDEILVDCT